MLVMPPDRFEAAIVESSITFMAPAPSPGLAWPMPGIWEWSIPGIASPRAAAPGSF